MSRNGTSTYHSFPGTIPDLVRSAVAAAIELGFPFCVRPETGRLLAVLAAGLPAGARVGETGTGTGAGLAWMVAAARPDVTLVSVERVDTQVIAARRVFESHPNVEIILADAATITDHGPFDLLVLDGGPGSGKNGDTPIEPAAALLPGGTLIVDDFTPATQWPPVHDGEVDQPRLHWIRHPDLHTTEIQVAPDLAVLVGRRISQD